MKWSPMPAYCRLYISAMAVLVVGLGSAVALYFTSAPADSDLVSDYLDSKSYTHELKAHGGNITVLASDFMRWAAGVWQGETRAYTVGSVTLAIALVLCLVARSLGNGDGE